MPFPVARLRRDPNAAAPQRTSDETAEEKRLSKSGSLSRELCQAALNEASHQRLRQIILDEKRGKKQQWNSETLKAHLLAKTKTVPRGLYNEAAIILQSRVQDTDTKITGQLIRTRLKATSDTWKQFIESDFDSIYKQLEEPVAVTPSTSTASNEKTHLHATPSEVGTTATIPVTLDTLVRKDLPGRDEFIQILQDAQEAILEELKHIAVSVEALIVFYARYGWVYDTEKWEVLTWLREERQLRDKDYETVELRSIAQNIAELVEEEPEYEKLLTPEYFQYLYHQIFFKPHEELEKEPALWYELADLLYMPRLPRSLPFADRTCATAVREYAAKFYAQWFRRDFRKGVTEDVTMLMLRLHLTPEEERRYYKKVVKPMNKKKKGDEDETDEESKDGKREKKESTEELEEKQELEERLLVLRDYIIRLARDRIIYGAVQSSDVNNLLELKKDKLNFLEFDAVKFLSNRVRRYSSRTADKKHALLNIPVVIMANNFFHAVGYKHLVRDLVPPVNADATPLPIKAHSLFELCADPNSDGPFIVNGPDGYAITSIEEARTHEDIMMGAFFDHDVIQTLCQKHGLSFRNRIRIGGNGMALIEGRRRSSEQPAIEEDKDSSEEDLPVSDTSDHEIHYFIPLNYSPLSDSDEETKRDPFESDEERLPCSESDTSRGDVLSDEDMEFFLEPEWVEASKEWADPPSFSDSDDPWTSAPATDAKKKGKATTRKSKTTPSSASAQAATSASALASMSTSATEEPAREPYQPPPPVVLTFPDIDSEDDETKESSESDEDLKESVLAPAKESYAEMKRWQEHIQSRGPVPDLPDDMEAAWTRASEQFEGQFPMPDIPGWQGPSSSRKKPEKANAGPSQKSKSKSKPAPFVPDPKSEGSDDDEDDDDDQYNSDAAYVEDDEDDDYQYNSDAAYVEDDGDDNYETITEEDESDGGSDDEDQWEDEESSKGALSYRPDSDEASSVPGELPKKVRAQTNAVKTTKAMATRSAAEPPAAAKPKATKSKEIKPDSGKKAVEPPPEEKAKRPRGRPKKTSVDPTPRGSSKK